MTPFAELTIYAGLDWASDHHDVVVVDKTGTLRDSFRFEHTGAAWQDALPRLKALGLVAVAIEPTAGRQRA